MTTNESQFTELIIKISSELAALNQNMTNVLSTLAKHETRLLQLETSKMSLKDTTVQWLVKGLVTATITIGSLTGAGALIAKFFGG